MEENENKPVEVAEEEITQPSREEILAASRKGNKNGDEMKKDIYKTGSRIAFRVGIIIAIVFSAVSLIVNKGEELLLPLYSVVFGMISAQCIYIGIKEKKKFLFAISVALAVLIVILIVLSILMLCGVLVW